MPEVKPALRLAAERIPLCNDCVSFLPDSPGHCGRLIGGGEPEIIEALLAEGRLKHTWRVLEARCDPDKCGKAGHWFRPKHGS